MANLGPVGKPDDNKKSSIAAKMGGMINNARRDGQKPKRWIWSSEFGQKVAREEEERLDSLLPMSVFWGLIHGGIDYMGIPVTVDYNTLHECVLDVE